MALYGLGEVHARARRDGLAIEAYRLATACWPQYVDRTSPSATSSRARTSASAPTRRTPPRSRPRPRTRSRGRRSGSTSSRAAIQLASNTYRRAIIATRDGDIEPGPHPRPRARGEGREELPRVRVARGESREPGPGVRRRPRGGRVQTRGRRRRVGDSKLPKRRGSNGRRRAPRRARERARGARKVGRAAEALGEGIGAMPRDASLQRAWRPYSRRGRRSRGRANERGGRVVMHPTSFLCTPSRAKARGRTRARSPSARSARAQRSARARRSARSGDPPSRLPSVPVFSPQRRKILRPSRRHFSPLKSLFSSKISADRTGRPSRPWATATRAVPAVARPVAPPPRAYGRSSLRSRPPRSGPPPPPPPPRSSWLKRQLAPRVHLPLWKSKHAPRLPPPDPPRSFRPWACTAPPWRPP